LYEVGLEALQGRRLGAAAEAFWQVLEKFPDERELHDRARLCLRVCERQSEPPPPPPQTLEERIYAATVALNAGAQETALKHLESAAAEAPDHDHVRYMLAVAHALRGQTSEALDQLRRAVELNPENRMLARQEPDFEPLRNEEAFKQVTGLPAFPANAAKRRPRNRRS
jgi:tetratricopeptide (TPR) repeat protein